MKKGEWDEDFNCDEESSIDSELDFVMNEMFKKTATGAMRYQTWEYYEDLHLCFKMKGTGHVKYVYFICRPTLNEIPTFRSFNTFLRSYEGMGLVQDVDFVYNDEKKAIKLAFERNGYANKFPTSLCTYP